MKHWRLGSNITKQAKKRDPKLLLKLMLYNLNSARQHPENFKHFSSF